MRKLGVTATAVVLAGTTSLVQAQTLTDMAVMIEAGAGQEGAEITYSDRILGDDGSVEYRDLSITDPDGAITFATDWLKGVPDSDDPATVTFTVADVITIDGNVDGEKIDFSINSDDLEIVTNLLLFQPTGATTVNAAINADSLAVEGGDPNSEVLRAIDVVLNDLSFSTTVDLIEMFAEGGLSIGKMDAKYDMTIDGQTQTADQQTESGEIAFAFDVPQGEEDAVGFLDGSKNGFITFASGESVFDASISDEFAGIDLSYAGTTAGGEGRIAMDDGTLTYDITNGAIDMTVTPGAGMPIPPVEIALSEFAWKMIFPMNSGSTPAEAVIDILLSELEVGEGLWSMIDPGKTIPRDPATLDIDLEAMVQVDAMKAMMEGADNPFDAGTIHSLDINTILLTIGGALLNAEGGMTFDNSGPMPMPNGSVNVTLEGAQGLANALVELGLVDQMQAGMFMGMVMAFAKAEGDDKFTSEITVNEQGIFANGQPIQ